MNPSKRLEAAAREALAAHDALRATRADEPASDDDGMPLDPAAWLTWRRVVSAPAYARWDAAMDALATALAEPKMSRHPHNFRPVCEAIIHEC